jgi:hypothetical protein
MHPSTGEPDLPRVFGRGSPVHAYWVERCVGFTAVEADGRRLGRIRRVEPAAPEAMLVIGRFRRRTVPATAVESVWPRESVVLIAEPEANGRARAERDDRYGDTVPWFELAPVDATPPEKAASAAAAARVGAVVRAAGGVTAGCGRSLRDAGRTVARWTRVRVRGLRRRTAAFLFRLARAVDAAEFDEK